MKALLYALLGMLACVSVPAQSITGKITASNGSPVEAATITILNANQATVADKDGNFTFSPISPGSYELSVSSVGYAAQVKAVRVAQGNTVVNITLAQQGKQLDEVVVSSDKIETRLQQTPAAVSSLSGQKLNDYRAWTIADLTALAPSVFVLEHGNSAGSNFFNIRGTMGFTNEQSIATYVDGVYQFDYYSAPINFNNIERIEILRGPQGTLYGRNAFSGVVNILTKKPTNTTGGYAQIDLGNYGQQRYSVGINAPIIKNKLFFNVAAQYNGRGSVYSNPTLHTDHFDNHQAFNINGNLKYLLSNRWQVTVNAKTESNKDKGAYPWASSDSAARNHPYQAFGTWDNTERRTNTNVSVAVSYYGPHFNFTSVTAGIGYHVWFPGRFDYDFTALKLISGSNASRSHQVTQEFRLSSPASAGRWKWTAGSFLFLDKTNTNYITYYEEDYKLLDSTAPVPFSTITNRIRNNTGVAFFGQATYSLTPQMDITAGIRYDVERKKRTESNDFEKDGMTTPLTPIETDTKTFHAFTPKLTVSYKIGDNSLVYASYARGFRVGGFNVGAVSVNNRVYNPEKSDNYEAAIKNTLFQDRLKLNLTAFYLQQKDQQVGTSTDGTNYLMLNVGDMNNFGIETEVAAIPIKNLSLEWNAAWSDARYAKLDLFDAGSATTKNYRDNHPINNPQFSSMAAAQYNYLVMSRQQVSLFVRLEYRYIGKYYLNFTNTESQEGYGLMNARAGITAKNFEVAVWGRNLNDARYISWGYGSYLLGSPRMWGITLTGRF